MTTRKRDEWVDGLESEDDGQGYDSELAEQSKAQATSSRKIKRRKQNSDDSGSDISEEEARDVDLEKPDENEMDHRHDLSEDANSNHGDLVIGDTSVDGDQVRVKPKLAQQLARSAVTAKKSGVIYLSRVPPFMKPHTVKHYLEPHAPSGLGRIFLSPETRDARQSRLKGGGNRKRNFTDGWIEFVSKREAKIAVEMLNARTMGGKKGSYYCDDVWNLKYLKGFKWRHLTEQIATENSERAARLRAGDAKERREVREYVRNVEFAKMRDGMERKKRGKGGNDDDDDEGVEDEMEPSRHRKDYGSADRRMHFKQAKVKAKTNIIADGSSVDVEKTLSRIF